MKCKPKDVTLQCFQMTEEARKNESLWPAWLHIEVEKRIELDNTINLYLYDCRICDDSWIVSGDDGLHLFADCEFKRDFDLIPDY